MSMEDLGLPFELVGLLNLFKAKGDPDFDVHYTKEGVEVILRWQRTGTSQTSKLPAENKLPITAPLIHTKTEPQLKIEPSTPPMTEENIGPLQETSPPTIETTTLPAAPVIVYKRPPTRQLVKFIAASPLKKLIRHTASTQTSDNFGSIKSVERLALTTVPQSLTPEPRKPYEGFYQTRRLKDFVPGYNWSGFEMYEYKCEDGSVNYIYHLEGAVREPYAYWVYFPTDDCPKEAYFLTYPGTPEYDQADRRWNEIDQYLKRTRYRDQSPMIDAFAQRRIRRGLKTMQLRPPEAKGEPLQPIPYDQRWHPADHKPRKGHKDQSQQPWGNHNL